MDCLSVSLGRRPSRRMRDLRAIEEAAVAPPGNAQGEPDKVRVVRAGARQRANTAGPFGLPPPARWRMSRILWREALGPASRLRPMLQARTEAKPRILLEQAPMTSSAFSIGSSKPGEMLAILPIWRWTFARQEREGRILGLTLSKAPTNGTIKRLRVERRSDR